MNTVQPNKWLHKHWRHLQGAKDSLQPNGSIKNINKFKITLQLLLLENYLVSYNQNSVIKYTNVYLY